MHWNNSNVIIRVNVHRVIWARTGPRQLSALRKLGLRIKHLTVEISASFGVEVRLPESKRVVEEILDAIDYGTRLKSFTMNIAGTLGVLSQNAIEALGYWKNLRVKGRVQISETLLGSPGGLSISKEIIHELEGAIKGHRKSIVRLERALSKCHVDDYFAPRPSDSSKEPKDYFSASHK